MNNKLPYTVPTTPHANGRYYILHDENRIVVFKKSRWKAEALAKKLNASSDVVRARLEKLARWMAS